MEQRPEQTHEAEIHPGYIFISEDAKVFEEVMRQGLVIGEPTGEPSSRPHVRHGTTATRVRRATRGGTRLMHPKPLTRDLTLEETFVIATKATTVLKKLENRRQILLATVGFLFGNLLALHFTTL